MEPRSQLSASNEKEQATNVVPLRTAPKPAPAKVEPPAAPADEAPLVLVTRHSSVFGSVFGPTPPSIIGGALAISEADARFAEYKAELVAKAVAAAMATAKPALTGGDRAIDAELAAEWCASWRKDEATIATYTGTYFNHWHKHFGTLGAMLVEGAWAGYIAARQLRVCGETVYKETCAARVFLLWSKDAGYITAVPDVPVVDKKAGAPRDPNRKPEAIRLEPEQIAAVLANLPEWSTGRHAPPGGTGNGRFCVRAYFEVAWETGLRRQTLWSLASPTHWRKGAKKLVIEDAIDKARFGRSVPVPARARAVLDACAPAEGLIFGQHDRRKYLRKAALAAGLDEYTADHLSNHDFRHSRSQHEADNNVPLTAIAHLRGWKNTSMADRYVHASEKRAGEAVALLDSALEPTGTPIASGVPSAGGTGTYDTMGDRRGSNPRHLEPQSSALPAELRPP